MTSSAATVEEYLAALPDDRREALEAVRTVMRDHLPPEVEEGMQYGMIGYYVPFSIYPEGYHCSRTEPLPLGSLASQKNHMSVSLFCIYGDDEAVARFQDRYLATGKKLDMGKGCIRFKRLEDFPLDVLAQTLDEIRLDTFIARYEATFLTAKAKRK